MPHDVFISYSQKDKTVAHAVCHSLESRGIRCWIAPRDIEPGREWMEALTEAITSSRILVLIFSSGANDSRHVAQEVSIAFDEEVVILPFRIEEVPPTRSLRFCIGTTHWLDAVTPPLERHLETLAARVAAFVDRPDERVRPPAAPPTPPTTMARWLTRVGGPVGLARWGAPVVLVLTIVALGVNLLRTGEPGPADGPALSLETANPLIGQAGIDGAGGGIAGAGGVSETPPSAPRTGDPSTATSGTAVTVPRPAPGTPPAPGPAERSEPTPAPAESPPAAPVRSPAATMDLQTAMALLDRSVAAKDLSSQGQVQALESLLASGFGYEGADLSGIRLAGANLSGGVFNGTLFAGTDLSRATIAAADLSRADLTFANLAGADLAGTRMEAASAAFADAESAVFREVSAARGTFYGGRLRGADFRNADLRGANFIMADLRGARFDGARLENALLVATLLDGATFAGATFGNTEISGSAITPGALTAAQSRGTCTSRDAAVWANPRIDVRLIQRIPNTTFSGGIEYSPVNRQNVFGLYTFSVEGLARCAPRSSDIPGIFDSNGREFLSLDWGGSFDADLVSRAGRERGWERRIQEHMTMMMDTLRARNGR